MHMSATPQINIRAHHHPKARLIVGIEKLERMPSVSAILTPLLGYLQSPAERLNVERVSELIASDNSLAAQCLHMANSALFGRVQATASIRSAVMAIGIERMRDVAFSCYMVKLLPSGPDGASPIVIWEHSLACALVARRLAKRIGFPDPEKAYLAGLLHDIGLVVGFSIFGGEYERLLQNAKARQIPIYELEQELLGFTHCDAGAMLAERWRLADDISAVIAHHHNPPAHSPYAGLLGLINLCDRICYLNGLGPGIADSGQIDWTNDTVVR